MKFLKIIILQVSWFIIVLYGSNISTLNIYAFSAFILFINYKISSYKISKSKYLKLSILFYTIGVIHDGILLKMEIINTERYTWNYLCVWPIFYCYYEDLFKKFIYINPFLQILIGGLGGVLSYDAAIRLGALEVNSTTIFYTYVFCFWGVFFPISIQFDHNSLLFKLLDKSIIFNFDKTGFIRHSEKYSSYELDRHSIGLVTGGTSGIGNAIFEIFKEQNVKCYITGRDISKLNNEDKLYFKKLDLLNFDSIKKMAKNIDKLDFIILNAGGMPNQFEQN